MARVPRGDPEKKGSQRGVPSVASNGPRQREERLLDEILGRAYVADQAPGKRTDVRLVCIVRLTQRGDCPCAQPRYELTAPACRPIHDPQG